MTACLGLHREGIIHTDLSLETVEIVDDADDVENVHVHEGCFGWRVSSFSLLLESLTHL